MIFTGVGSRETPKNILDLMRRLSHKLVSKGWTLRSGGADGADEYFAYGWGDAKVEDDSIPPAEIFLPWHGFNGLYRGDPNCIIVQDEEILAKAYKLLKKVHPAFDKLTRGPLALHTRNCFQVLGRNLDSPSNYCIAYSKIDQNGEPTGGTRTAIKIAEMNKIKVRNLYLEEDCIKIEEFLRKE